jgi:hypothetical protein
MFCWCDQMRFFYYEFLYFGALVVLSILFDYRSQASRLGYFCWLRSPHYRGPDDCAFARFSRAKNEIAAVPSFGRERERSQPTRLPLQLNQAAARSAGHCFGAADDVHFGEDCFHVRLHSAFADK